MGAVEVDLRRGLVRTPTLREIEECDAVFILGEDITNVAPRMALSVRQSVRQSRRLRRSPNPVAPASGSVPTPALPPGLERHVRERSSDGHGRQTCHAQRPKCSQCALYQQCAYVGSVNVQETMLSGETFPVSH